MNSAHRETLFYTLVPLAIGLAIVIGFIINMSGIGISNL
jgi:hypothetical protein